MTLALLSVQYSYAKMLILPFRIFYTGLGVGFVHQFIGSITLESMISALVVAGMGTGQYNLVLSPSSSSPLNAA
ncbi:uncharacterized protein BT62DRAFT_1009884 [Guyanagaster necrorhizus]|uniref:Uncharacterized protein n=1 Tax=Guyanagaster necrorhizus TaxID=856835 RepID=A0A9P8AQH7_9AGAR|nr:uncharacterized protein BT62DRAFT_1009884 [Guyanagaster necrorhizus MCA 3950]KAG7442882.1 hypothetical protein BT62DRAFT_1009884 [Guyanagaster necrorhizus MCA 3950]